MPITLVLVCFSDVIVNILADNNYIDSAKLITILGIGMIFKPLGRVFGLTLDAIGKPRVNFYMLLMSCTINVGMNALLIPKMGVEGAAIATTSSIIITIMIGQLSIARFTAIQPVRDMLHVIKVSMREYDVLDIKGSRFFKSGSTKKPPFKFPKGKHTMTPFRVGVKTDIKEKSTYGFTELGSRSSAQHPNLSKMQNFN